jgi:hypothetical protein
MSKEETVSASSSTSSDDDDDDDVKIQSHPDYLDDRALMQVHYYCSLNYDDKKKKFCLLSLIN